ncbi:MAG TPA: 3-phosphoshikimate 1-carboxyvinyltransferase [Actinomycetota bacterium]|nr:3-phosphoshikimate 1-carboxyvinyltransferase [Actinomycetota bacterium]
MRPAERVEGDLAVPGDKSISHRALMIAAAGHGDCTLIGLSSAHDVASTLGAIRHLADVLGPDLPSLEVEGLAHSGSHWEIMVRGRGIEAWRNPGRTLDCGNSGTTMRSLLGLLAACNFQATLDGDDSLRRRPMERVAAPLRRMGASITTGAAGRPPVVIRGSVLTGIDHELPVASAQVKTALLFAGLHAEGETTVRGGGASRDHTERMLRHLGVDITGSPNHLVVKSTQIQNAESLNIPGDLSSGAFLLVAAAIRPGSDLRVRNVGLNPTRTGILEVLRSYGADVRIEDEAEVCGEPRGTVRIISGDRRPLHIDAHHVPALIDELPLVAILGAFAEGPTVIEGAAELRVKESDRIAATAAGLEALGVRVETAPDGLTVTGDGRAAGGVVDSAGDHRIAMAFSAAAIGADEPVTIRHWEAVDISYPSFGADLDSIAVRPA